MDEARAGELLRAERERIERALRELAPSSGDELVHGDEHLGEEATGLAERLRNELAAVERAEARLAAGTYGLSVESGQPIPDERLELIPTAERTAEEQARFERGR